MKTAIIISALMAAMTASAQQIASLPAPQASQSSTLSVMDALGQRRSVRSYADRPLSDQTLSTLLWAACGISEPATGKITAPSTVNAQDIMVYVCRADGAWLYDPKANSLTRVTDRDLRPDIAGPQAFAATAPVSLLLVADMNRMDNAHFCAMDAAYVSENIYLACTALGLGTVARATMNTEALCLALSLDDKHVPLLNHPVGYAD